MGIVGILGKVPQAAFLFVFFFWQVLEGTLWPYSGQAISAAHNWKGEMSHHWGKSGEEGADSTGEAGGSWAVHQTSRILSNPIHKITALSIFLLRWQVRLSEQGHISKLWTTGWRDRGSSGLIERGLAHWSTDPPYTSETSYFTFYKSQARVTEAGPSGLLLRV